MSGGTETVLTVLVATGVLVAVATNDFITPLLFVFVMVYAIARAAPYL